MRRDMLQITGAGTTITIGRTAVQALGPGHIACAGGFPGDTLVVKTPQKREKAMFMTRIASFFTLAEAVCRALFLQ
jgi:hypothetical protein